MISGYFKRYFGFHRQAYDEPSSPYQPKIWLEYVFFYFSVIVLPMVLAHLAMEEPMTNLTLVRHPFLTLTMACGFGTLGWLAQRSRLRRYDKEHNGKTS